MGTRPSRSEALGAWIRALEAVKVIEESPGTTLPGLLPGLADQHGSRPALLGEEETFSYADLAARANRYARWAIDQGLGPGHAACLLMPNRPEYVAAWLGLTRAGCTLALVNTNLAGTALLHSVAAAQGSEAGGSEAGGSEAGASEAGASEAGASVLLVAASLLPAVAAVAGQLGPGIRIWVHGEASGPWPRIDSALDRLDATPLDPAQHPFPAPTDRALLIYTSGTTGLPKAANVSHARIVEWSFWFAGMMDAQPDDRLYNCLPMYHSVGGIVAIGAMLVRGGSVLIRPRFSASRFWNDVVDGNCTIFQYIGELCRYLTHSPPHPRERQHRLRLACGNGLQGGVWEAMQERFGIPRVLEYYAATEGGVSLYNTEGKPGSVGRVPPFLAQRSPVAIIQVDPGTGEPVRDLAGRCIACGVDAAGELIGQLPAAAGPNARRFDGYTDEAASARKVLHGVFAAGDRWFRTGDLMRRDAAGFFTFVDRIGDTVRWKGENVSTTEVSAALRACPGVTDAAVFGVAVPGTEGRAVMAAVTTDAGFDPAILRGHLAACLPEYAQPLFVRRCDTLALTGTYKLVKVDLARDGYADAGDPVWFNDRSLGRLVPLDDALRHALDTGCQRV